MIAGRYGKRGWGELFDLEADPGEHENLFNESAHRAVRDRLVERLTSRFLALPGAGTAVVGVVIARACSGRTAGGR